MGHVVACVDGSDPSLGALDWAVDEAARQDAELRIVYAPLWDPYEGSWPSSAAARPPGTSVAEHILTTARERVRPRARKVAVELLSGDPEQALLREARDADTMVVAARGRGGAPGLQLGSVALAVASGAQCPVVVVRGEGAAPRGSRVVLGTGHGGAEQAAAEFAFRAAGARDCSLWAVHAWRSPERGVSTHAHTLSGAPDPRMREAEWALGRAVRAAAERHPGVRLERHTPEGLPRDALLTAAGAADLLVVGARRAVDAPGTQLSPVSLGILHLAPCPVAVVPEAG
jgi:nucleotide-binding universal stress UspA family protein